MSHSSRVLKSTYLEEVRLGAQANSFQPRGTVRCEGPPLFRTNDARAFGCLLDLDTEITAWECLPLELTNGSHSHIPDFLVHSGSTSFLLDATAPPKWAPQAAAAIGRVYLVDRYDLQAWAIRLTNARDLLRYATYSVSLSDRIRFLTVLDEHGSLPLATCAEVIKNSSDAVGAIASLALQRFVAIEIDDVLIGPNTRISKA